MENNYKLGIKASFVTILINLALTIFKLAAGFLGKSNAMIADGFHTLSDVLATSVVIIGLRIASKEADEDHPYGHERFELIFSKILSVILIITGLFIGYESLTTIISGEIETPGRIALIAAIVSILAKEGMYRYIMSVAKKTNSVSLEAEAWHHRSDAMSSIGTFVGILGARLGLPILDPLAGIVVSLMIIKVGIDLYTRSIRGLVDESADDETIREIMDVVLTVEEVKEIADLKTRKFANQYYVDVDIKIDGCKTVHEGHDVATEVHDRVESEIESVKHCMVHIEPYQDSVNC